MNVYFELLNEIGIHDPSLLSSHSENRIRGESYLQNDRDLEQPFVSDYQMETTYVLKKIHRYSRKDRFRFLLYQLLNVSGTIPKWVQRLVANELKLVKVSKSKVWNQIRTILKRNRLRRYYNMIPNLIAYACKLRVIAPYPAIVKCLNDFYQMDLQFDTVLRSQWNRSYFPNLRFIALKLCQANGIEFPYSVPLIRTTRKKGYLNLIFNDFVLQ